MLLKRISKDTQMIRSLALALPLLFSLDSYGYSFSDVVTRINSHAKIESSFAKAAATKEEGDVKSSWGDPRFRIEARNYPIKSFKNDISMMTGIEFGAAQNLPITSKNSYIEKSYDLFSKSLKLDTVHQKRALLQLLWNLAIIKRNLKEDVEILQENLAWVNNMLAISKKLYSNGKTSQQAVLELQVRKAQITAELSNKSHELEHADERLSYLYGEQGKKLVLDSVPWKLLDSEHTNGETTDYKEKALGAALQANEAKLKAEKLSIIPDITLSASYMKRSNYENVGDFVSFGISFPIPLSKKEHSEFDKAVHERVQAVKDLKDYSWYRKTELAGLHHQIQKLTDELKILTKETILYAKSSRDITSKSYGLGNTSYIELTQAELKLQDLLLRKNSLQSQLASKTIQFKFLRGDDLYVE
jgi:cobalt-zinc-cadmium efflux system outer membrane protein